MEKIPEAERFRVILCGANAYDQKYYFNPKFEKIPANIREELNIICVLFTKEIGGVFTVGFDPYGDVVLESTHEDGDLLFDEISARLMIHEIERKKREMLDALSIYFKVTFLHQNPADLLSDDEDDPSSWQ